MSHVPVLVQEVVEYLNAQSGQKFIDGTAGGGGHIQAILEKNNKAEVLGIDLDRVSLDKLNKKLINGNLSQNCTLVHGNYADMLRIASEHGFGQVDGILLDLGFSSIQLDDPKRGFSFQTPARLDMRYDLSQEFDAYALVNTWPETEIEKIILEYGEEKFAKKIARSIVQQRSASPVSSSDEIFRLVESSLPKPVRYKAADSVRRVFQAFRIAVNKELENLQRVLPDAIKLLAPKGRLVIISFHSLEDRIVKEFFLNEARGCVCPVDFPECRCGQTPRIKILTKKPITASERELSENSRSKPAKLRAAEKI